MRVKTIATLFSGGELVGMAARLLGLTHFWGIEINPQIAAIARKNGFRVILGDVINFDFCSLAERPDWLHASPPCINASIATPSLSETIQDILMAKGIIRAISALKPKTFSLENVKSYQKFKAFKMITQHLKTLGYKISFAVLNAADYGDPQIRRRLILLAHKKSSPIWPQPTHSEYPMLGCARWKNWHEPITDLIPKLQISKKKDCPLCKLGQCDGHLASWQENYLPIALARPKNQRTALLALGGNTTCKRTILRANEPMITVTANSVRHAHRIMILENNNYRIYKKTTQCLARWQSLPDSYILPQDKVLASQIIGNGIPLEMMKAILRSNK